MKEQDKITVKNLNKTEITNKPDKKFKVMVIKLLIVLEKRADKLSETFKKEIRKYKKEPSRVEELK